jgi:hypothetical protein
MTPDMLQPNDQQEVSIQEISEILKNRGWEIKTMTREEANLVPLDKNCALGCIDGRLVEADEATVKQAYEHGPKIPGGLIGLALVRFHDGTDGGITLACEAMQKTTIAPGAHDVNEDHCGAKKLAATGKYESIGLPKLVASAQSIVEIIGQYKGMFVHHIGNHEEKGMIFNLDASLTRVPDGSYFQGDLAWLVKMGVEPKLAVEFLASTVEQLKPDAKIAYIVT